MAYYNTCPKCGCNLDPGEKCDCEGEKEKRQEFFSRNLKTEPGGGQLSFVFDGMESGHEKKMCV